MKIRLIDNILRSPLARSMCFVLFIITFTSGCYLPLPFPKNDSGSLAKKDEVKTLIGESQESTIRKLGLPEQWVSQGERQFMTYSLTSRERKVVHLIFLIPVAVFDQGGRSLHCYRLEIDSNSLVKDYKIDSTARLLQHPNCQHLFTNDWELANPEIYVMRNIPTQTQFKEGDLISMTTSKEITISSKKVTSLKIAVLESDSTIIKGRLSGFLSYADETMENEVGSIIEIMRGDVENIWIEEIRP